MRGRSKKTLVSKALHTSESEHTEQGTSCTPASLRDLAASELAHTGESSNLFEDPESMHNADASRESPTPQPDHTGQGSDLSEDSGLMHTDFCG